MAGHRFIDTSPRFIAVDLQRQLIPGSFEHTLDYLIDHEPDLTGFDARYWNDLAGATALGVLARKLSMIVKCELSRYRTLFDGQNLRCFDN